MQDDSARDSVKRRMIEMRSNSRHYSIGDEMERRETSFSVSRGPKRMRGRRRRGSKVTDTMKEQAYSRILSSYHLSEWVVKYCVDTTKLKPLEKETFLDASGKLRYVDNWQSAATPDHKEDDMNSEEFFLRTGCMKLSSLWEYFHRDVMKGEGIEESHEGSSSSSSCPETMKKLAYISEWQRLWIYLENEESDELYKHAPLFRLLIEFLFHPRLQRFMLLLVIYELVVTTAVVCFFWEALNPMVKLEYYFQIVAQAITYFTVVMVYRGELQFTAHTNTSPHSPPIPTHTTTTAPPPSEVDVESQSLPIVPDNNNHLKDLPVITSSTSLSNHFNIITKELRNRMKEEFNILFSCFLVCSCFMERQKIEQWKTYHKKRNELMLKYRQQRKRSLSYHELLNISLKFLTKVNGIEPEKINFDRWSYRCMLIFIAFLYPTYVFFGHLLVTYLSFIEPACKDGGLNNALCEYYFYISFVTFGMVTRYLIQMIYGMSVLTALSALAYGAEIVYRLVDVWIVKFKSLRKVEDYDMEVFFTAEGPVKRSNGVGSGRRSFVPDTNSIISPLQKSRLSPVLDDQEETKEESTRDIVRPNSFSLIPGERAASPLLLDDMGDTSSISDHPLYEWLQRDATEHYFFICEVCSAAGHVWSPALLGLFFMGIGTTFVYWLYIYFNQHTLTIYAFGQLLIYVVVRLFIMFLYPIISLCHANSYIYELTDCFKQSSREDFELIGGGARWVELMKNCPAAWTFYGVWITWDRLFGVLWTTVAASVASGVAALCAQFVK